MITKEEKAWKKRFESFVVCPRFRNLYRTQPGTIPYRQVEMYTQDATETPDCYEYEMLYAYYLYLIDKENENADNK